MQKGKATDGYRQLIIKAHQTLDVTYLDYLSNSKLYSWNTKSEIILELESKFNFLKDKNIHSLIYSLSKCKFCYPDAPVYTFFDSESNYVVGRYVITETQDQYIFEKCKNMPIENDSNGIPF